MRYQTSRNIGGRTVKLLRACSPGLERPGLLSESEQDSLGRGRPDQPNLARGDLVELEIYELRRKRQAIGTA